MELIAAILVMFGIFGFMIVLRLGWFLVSVIIMGGLVLVSHLTEERENV